MIIKSCDNLYHIMVQLCFKSHWIIFSSLEIMGKKVINEGHNSLIKYANLC